MDQITVVSADGHGGPPSKEYAPYIEAAYRDRLDDLAHEEVDHLRRFQVNRARNNDLLDAVDERGLLAAEENLSLYWDASSRLAQLDAEGIAGEMVISGSEYSAPFFHVANHPRPADMRAAGVRAYHRWLVDFLADSGGRLFGSGYALPSADMDEMLTELRWVVEHGLVSVETPGYVNDPNLPPLVSDFYEPYWAACAESGIVLQAHAGWGMSLGEMSAMIERVLSAMQSSASGTDADPMAQMAASAAAQAEDDGQGRSGNAILADLRFRSVLWKLILGGVFDRHPTLKLVLTEMRADWLPAALAYLDEFAAHRTDLGLELKPSEYFARNCAITPSSIRRHEVAMRDEIGVDRLMFGSDMPHPEGTWPNTRQWLGYTFADVGEEDLRKILGENAISFYNLDRKPFDEAAARIGPTFPEIFAGADVDSRMLEHWDRRSGYGKPPEVLDIQGVETMLNEDFTRV